MHTPSARYVSHNRSAAGNGNSLMSKQFTHLHPHTFRLQRKSARLLCQRCHAVATSSSTSLCVKLMATPRHAYVYSYKLNQFIAGCIGRYLLFTMSVHNNETTNQ